MCSLLELYSFREKSGTLNRWTLKHQSLEGEDMGPFRALQALDIKLKPWKN